MLHCYDAAHFASASRSGGAVLCQYRRSTWQEWQPLVKAASQAASSALQGIFGTQLTGGAGSGTGPHRYTDLLQFFETDVVGNPIAKTLEFGQFLCKAMCRQ